MSYTSILIRPCSAEAEDDGATTSTMAVVSKRRSLSFMFDGVNHYYPDGTPMAPEHFEAGASTSQLNLNRSCHCDHTA